MSLFTTTRSTWSVLVYNFPSPAKYSSLINASLHTLHKFPSRHEWCRKWLWFWLSLTDRCVAHAACVPEFLLGKKHAARIHDIRTPHNKKAVSRLCISQNPISQSPIDKGQKSAETASDCVLNKRLEVKYVSGFCEGATVDGCSLQTEPLSHRYA